MTRSFVLTLLRFACVGLLAFGLLLAGYVHFDPYKVVRERADYSNHPPDVIANRDHISVSVYLRNRTEQHYNAFIFGSSRGLAFKPSHWVQYLDTGARPFLFNASGESIHGIASKVRFLDRTGVEIRDALIVLCHDFSFVGKGHHTGPLFIKHPAVYGGSWWNYHWTFLSAYLAPEFLHAFYYNKLTGRYEPWMSSVLANYKIANDPITNEVNLVTKEAEIMADPDKFYGEREAVFYERGPHSRMEPDQITREHEQLLVEVLEIFKRQGTDHRVVISPLYDQRTFSDRDIAVLRKLFGTSLHDYSGVNAHTIDKHNYYEASHYRPQVGDSILSEVYSSGGP